MTATAMKLGCVAMLFGAAVYGACHLFAWNFVFHTPSGQLLWRICSLVILIFPMTHISLVYFLQTERARSGSQNFAFSYTSHLHTLQTSRQLGPSSRYGSSRAFRERQTGGSNIASRRRYRLRYSELGSGKLFQWGLGADFGHNVRSRYLLVADRNLPTYISLGSHAVSTWSYTYLSSS